MTAEALIAQVVAWAGRQSDIRAVALVGSHARGSAHADSDIDLVLLCVDPARYLKDAAWTETFGAVARTASEDWGMVQSLRVFYLYGPEVEFGLTSPAWAALPPDRGTAEVIEDGARVLLDRDGSLRSLMECIGRARRDVR